MPTIRFTQDAVDALRPPLEGRVYYWDENNPGFGLRITSKNRRVWVAMYRVKGQHQQVMETIATTFQLPTLKDARDRAMKSQLQARSGVNPVSHLQARVRREKAVSFKDVSERYLVEYVERNCRDRTLSETRRILEHDIFPHLGNRPLNEITRDDIEDLLERKASSRDRPRKGVTNGAGSQANRNLAILKTLFGWCLRKQLIEKDPTINIDRLVKEVARDRVLEDDEIKSFWHACEYLGYPYAPLFKLLLLTGQRRGEVSGMRRSEINLEKGQWTIPRERSKNDKAHVVHLSPLALQIIEGIPNLGDTLFGTVNNFGRMKRELDTAITAEHGSELEHWTLHDLRRTCASGMAQLNVAPHIVDKILNHTSSALRGIALVYNRYSYVAERQDALDLWATHVQKLVKRAVL